MAQSIRLLGKICLLTLSVSCVPNLAVAEPAAFDGNDISDLNFGPADTNSFDGETTNFEEFGLSEEELNTSILMDSGTSPSTSAACTKKGTLDYIEMRMTIAAHQEDIYEAYKLFSQSNPGYGGELELEIDILPSGEINNIKLNSGVALPFAQAVSKKIGAINFPACEKPSQFLHTMYFGPVIETTVDPTLSTCLSPQEIETTLRAQTKAILTSYKKVLKETPNLEGTVKYRFNILPAGKTESIAIESGEEFSFSEEVRKLLLPVKFPSCHQETIVSVPIRFIPSPKESSSFY